jgi:hypothetical protein
MEIDGGFEIHPITEATGRIFDPLDFGVDAFTGGVGYGMFQISQDIGPMDFQHPGFFDDGFQATMRCPTIPPIKVVTCRLGIREIPQLGKLLFDRPGAE